MNEVQGEGQTAWCGAKRLETAMRENETLEEGRQCRLAGEERGMKRGGDGERDEEKGRRQKEREEETERGMRG